MTDNIVKFRLDPAHIDALDRLATGYSSTRSEIIRRLILPRLSLAIGVLEADVDTLSGKRVPGFSDALPIITTCGDDVTEVST